MELRDLYQEVILDHNKRPRNFGVLEGGSQAAGHNPMCGDRVSVYVRMDGDRVAEARFTGNGCAISKASASMMTEAVTGRTLAEVQGMFTTFQEMVTGKAEADDEKVGKLVVLSGVSEYPSRVKCAMLAWHALVAAIEGASTTVTTEAI
ncbi:iron-sulfur cluster assembly scaffold protein [Luteitalea sp. TBR-22]|uniref:Fe-S cluster assembly sulfur transfer protein SufU n=1 Tax=Luteitalea sp. TBR-22 TaxID=2802971 RepID=UPI001AF1D0EC|nr:SUF system NifU family Fe-S cluster assembly protein [Luteitalea sp. TBR-22]BCS35933.1 iron-sulfur cluster assembly scaffold protein [Luteitalea sp. TBR-22]